MSTSSSSLSLNDPVFVTRDSSSPRLEGVVAYLGEVAFGNSPVPLTMAPESDWVGVRLTGPSVGQGKNNGTVQDKTYFEAPEKCGIFVRRNMIQQRTLNKLEELKLKRELATTTTSSSSLAASSSVTGRTTTPPRTDTTTRLTPPRTGSGSAIPRASSPATTATTATATATASGSTKTLSKLEELRQRRAALNARKQEAGGISSPSVAATTNETATSSISAAATTTTTQASASSAEAVKAVDTSSSILTPRSIPSTSTMTPKSAVAASSASASQLEAAATTASLEQELARAKELLTSKERDCNELRKKLEQSQQQFLQTQQKLEQQTAAAVANAAAASVSASQQEGDTDDKENAEKMQELRLQYSKLQQEFDTTKSQLQQEVSETRSLQETTAMELATAQSQISFLQGQLQDVSHRQENSNTTQQYKERAKLQAQLASANRKLELLEQQTIPDLETTIEDLALDKEQLEQEKEQLEDLLEETKLDADTALVQVEELKLELEDLQQQQLQQVASSVSSSADATVPSSNKTGVGVVAGEGSTAAVITTEDQDQEDVAHALSVQNARLRQALVRLREQTAMETLEWGRQLREAEKDATAGRAAEEKAQALQTINAKLADEMNDLKDMVEQGSAFEGMVEDLSDRVLGMEDDIMALRSTIRDLEEAAELTAEMEEVQADELRALTQDLDGRDTIIRNLEEAIKMQRRREEDFLRTVANYRTTVATLKQEKQALLALQQGGEGEKSDLIAATQNALARASQLVSDAAQLRRREARAVVDRINQQTYRHLSFRLESLLPQALVSPEVSAIKGELTAAKVVSSASSTLDGIAATFGKTIRPALDVEDSNAALAGASSSLELSDEVRQKITTLIYQAEFAHVVIGVSSDVLRLLFAGQWSDLLSHESSIELGSILGHSTPSLDSTLASVLKTLKEEGALTPDQSNIGALRQTIQVTMQSLRSEIERDDRTLLPASWNPPAWELLKNVSIAKFACQGAAAAMSAVLHQTDNFVAPLAMVTLYNLVEKSSAQAKAVCLRLCNLDITNESLVSELSTLAKKWADSANTLLLTVSKALLSNEGTEAAESCVGRKVLPTLAKLLSILRTAHLNPNETESYHALSPEADDPWAGVAALTRSIRAIEGDAEDVHYLYRARTIEHHLDQAVENEPKLEMANAKVASLEKSLSSKTKEISLQTARLSELEKLLAKSNSSPIRRGQALDFRSSEEFNKLQEENRVLTEAVDVMQRQVDDYENEIRSLKDFRSPGKGTRNRTPRRAITSISDASPYSTRGGGSDEPSTDTNALEATIFRPALQKALRDAAKWKAASMQKVMLDLPPLPTPLGSSTGFPDSVSDDLMELTSALANYRIEKASVTVVDVTRRDASRQLRESNAIIGAATDRLHAIVRRYDGRAF